MTDPSLFQGRATATKLASRSNGADRPWAMSKLSQENMPLRLGSHLTCDPLVSFMRIIPNLAAGIGYLPLDRFFPLQIWPHVDKLNAEVFEGAHPIFKRAVYSGLGMAS